MIPTFTQPNMNIALHLSYCFFTEVAAGVA
jgi:hypothetical protein